MSIIPALRLSTLLTAWLLLLAGQALASSPQMQIKDLKQPIAAGSPTTYADLLKLVFPERTEGQGMAPQTPPVRQLNDYYKTQPLTAKQGYESVWALPIKAQGRALLLLLIPATGEWVKEEGDDEEQQFDLLALFQTAPTPRLLDLVDIGQGQMIGQVSGFWTGGRLNLTPATQACLIFQEHFNSSQSYLQIHLLWVRGERLEELLSVSPFDQESLCETFATRTVFWTEPDKGREYPKVMARLTVKMEPSPRTEDCGKNRQRGFTSSYQGAWQWDPAQQKYHQVSGNLDQLYKFYDKYY